MNKIFFDKNHNEDNPLYHDRGLCELLVQEIILKIIFIEIK